MSGVVNVGVDLIRANGLPKVILPFVKLTRTFKVPYHSVSLLHKCRRPRIFIQNLLIQ